MRSNKLISLILLTAGMFSGHLLFSQELTYPFAESSLSGQVSSENEEPLEASPWENGYNESFNGKLRDELLNGEIFYTLKEAQILIEQWRIHYNTVRPHSSLDYRSPAPQTVITKPSHHDLSYQLNKEYNSQLNPDSNLNNGIIVGGRSIVRGENR